MKEKNILFLGILIFYLTSCVAEIEPLPQLTLERSYYTGDKIRFDGCYFNDYPGLPYGAYVFYYRNGVLASFIDRNGITAVTEFTNLYKLSSNGYNWFIFKISGDTLISQKISGDNSIVTDYYKLLNDTTFLYFKRFDSYHGGITTFKNDTNRMQFIKMYPRPDSTNIFIK